MPTQRIPGYCALCRSRCGCISVVQDGRLLAVEPNPAHPTGSALCAKGRAAPELVGHAERLLYPLRRTRPKGAGDPGWQRISWDEALDFAAGELNRLRAAHGPEGVAFSVTSPSGTAMSDSISWVERLIHAFGSPNEIYATEICNWHKDFAHAYTFGAGLATPDFARAGCVLLWGHNPSTSWLTHASGAAAAKARGAKLIVVDPRHAGLAGKADLWLRVRPGTDGALALGIAGVMLEEGWFDRDFVRRWTNGPLLVRSDNGRFLSEADLRPGGSASVHVAWDERAGHPVLYDCARGQYEDETRDAQPALSGSYTLGNVACRPAFDLYRALCRRYPPERVAAICWLPAAEVRAAARLFFENRPMAYYVWTGVGQHDNATQTDRAIALLAALTGSFDAPGGNVQFASVPMNDVSGAELMPPGQKAKALGLAQRPLGPARSGWIGARDFYRAALHGEPYPIRALVGFGANLALAHADSRQMRAALAALEFFVQADLFLTPTAALADLVLPVASAWEREGLRAGFEISEEAQSLVQLRAPVVAPRGEARSDTWIVFELARRLGLGEHFWHGDIEAGYRHRLAPSGISLEALREAPEGIRVPLHTRYRKYAGDGNGSPPGFNTPTRKVEIYSQRFLEHGYAPLPEFVEPALGPGTRPELAGRFPLVLTCAKDPHFCHSQHRALPRLRRHVPAPVVEMHPATAAARGIGANDWVTVETPYGAIRARARLKDGLDERVVAAQHGWWQACAALGLPGYDPYAGEGANYNLLVRAEQVDPISGSVPHRAALCEVRKLGRENP